MCYKKILVAIDGSETASLALKEASRLCRAFHAELFLLNVVDAFPMYNLAVGVNFERCREIMRENGMIILQHAQAHIKEDDIEPHLDLIEISDSGKKISEKIVDAAMAIHADLIVMGSHGRRGFKRLLLGSVAEEVIRIAHVPVLLMRAYSGERLLEPDKSYQRILCAFDGSDAAYLALNEAMKITKALQAQMGILHVVNEFPMHDFVFAKHLVEYQQAVKNKANAMLDNVKKYAQERDVLADVILLEMLEAASDIPSKIIDAAINWHADLLVVCTHGRKGLNRLLLGSIAEEAIRTSHIPVLLTRVE